MMDQTNKLMV